MQNMLQCPPSEFVSRILRKKINSAPCRSRVAFVQILNPVPHLSNFKNLLSYLFFSWHQAHPGLSGSEVEFSSSFTLLAFASDYPFLGYWCMDFPYCINCISVVTSWLFLVLYGRTISSIPEMELYCSLTRWDSLKTKHLVNSYVDGLLFNILDGIAKCILIISKGNNWSRLPEEVFKTWCLSRGVQRNFLWRFLERMKKQREENSNYQVSLAELAAEMIAYLFIYSSCCYSS